MKLDFFSHLSLRTKLLTILTIVVCLSICPIIFLSYKNTVQQNETTVKAEFERVSLSISDNIVTALTHEQKMTATLLQRESDLVVWSLNEFHNYYSKNNPATVKIFVQIMRSWGTHLALYRSPSDIRFASPFLSRLIQSNPLDEFGRPIFESTVLPSLSGMSEINTNTTDAGYEADSNRTRVTFIRYSDKTSGNAQTGTGANAPYYLALKDTKYGTFVVLVPIDFIETIHVQLDNTIETTAMDAVKDVNALPENVTLRIVAEDGREIVRTGPKSRLTNPEPLFQTAKKKGKVTAVYGQEDNGVVASVVYIKPNNWFIETSIPVAALSYEALSQAIQQFMIVVATMALILILSIFALNHMLTPLGQLASAVQQFSSVDLGADNTKQETQDIIKTLPKQGHDEIGKLSDVFQLMLEKINDSVSQLKKTLKAQHRIEGELQAAHGIQMQLLPDQQAIDDWRFSSYNLITPMREVGGDFFDVFKTRDGKEALIIGDVSGKGVSAALFMCVAISLVRSAMVGTNKSPGEVMQYVNDGLAVRNETCMFTTLWIGLFDAKTGTLEFANGAHCSPIIHSVDGSVRWLRNVSGPLVGPLPGSEFQNYSVKLEPGDTCFLYTDGILEAMNESRSLFGETRIEATMKALPQDATAKQVIDTMYAAVIEYRGKARQSDDITMLAFRFEEAKEAAK